MEDDDLYGDIASSDVACVVSAAGLYEGIFAKPCAAQVDDTYLQHKVNELEEKLLAQRAEIEGLKGELESRNRQAAQVALERDTLLRNISCLYNTAREEMARKQQEITSLRTELAQAKQPLPPPPRPPHGGRAASSGVLQCGMMPARQEQPRTQRGPPPPLLSRAPLPLPTGRHGQQPTQPCGTSGGLGAAAERDGVGPMSIKRGREGSSDLEELRTSGQGGGRGRSDLQETGSSKRQRSAEGWAEPARVVSGSFTDSAAPGADVRLAPAAAALPDKRAISGGAGPPGQRGLTDGGCQVVQEYAGPADESHHVEVASSATDGQAAQTVGGAAPKTRSRDSSREQRETQWPHADARATEQVQEHEERGRRLREHVGKDRGSEAGRERDREREREREKPREWERERRDKERERARGRAHQGGPDREVDRDRGRSRQRERGGDGEWGRLERD